MLMAMASLSAKLRWLRPTPGRLVGLLLIVGGLLWLSSQWFPKGYAVLLAVATVGIVLLALLLWFLVALIFRWRFQFSIRTILVLTAAVALSFSWLRVEMKKAAEQEKAAAAIRGGGGRVWYDWELTPWGTYTSDAEPLGPAWARGLLGDDFFGRVVDVAFVGGFCEFTAARHGSLKCLNIRTLRLVHYSGRATDADLDCLAGMSELRLLEFFVTDSSPSSDLDRERLQQALPNCTVRIARL
jgi:hypothetical protein